MSAPLRFHHFHLFQIGFLVGHIMATTTNSRTMTDSAIRIVSKLEGYIRYQQLLILLDWQIHSCGMIEIARLQIILFVKNFKMMVRIERFEIKLMIMITASDEVTKKYLGVGVYKIIQYHTILIIDNYI